MFGSSQNFGYSEAATQQAPTRTKQEEKQTCVPVTVRILQDAVARHAESPEILIHGAEAGVVHLVGTIEAMVQQSAMLEFQLNDASGRMKVRYYGSTEAFAGLAAGRYVSVIGNVRTSPAVHLSAMTMQAVSSADEVSYHMIEVAHAALRLRNPTAAAGLRTGVATADPITPAKQLGLGLGLSPSKVEAPAQPNMAAPVAMQTPVKADLRSSVVDVLNQEKETSGEEGIDLSALVARLRSMSSLDFVQASADKVKEILTKLVEEGDVFTTIDDDHFAMV